MGSIKLNDYKVIVENSTVEIQYKNETTGRYYIEALIESTEQTMAKTNMAKEYAEVMMVYLRSMKRYPKNQQPPF